MADTPINRAAALTALADNSAGAITEGVMRSVVAGLTYFRGTWSNTTAYAVNDVVTSGGLLYVCITANTGDALTVTASWTQITSQTVAATNIFQGTYQVVSPTTGSTVNLATADITIIDPAGVLLALTLALPSNPVDKQMVEFTTTYAITTVTFSNGTAAPILGLGTTGSARLMYSSSKAKWYKRA